MAADMMPTATRPGAKHRNPSDRGRRGCTLSPERDTLYGRMVITGQGAPAITILPSRLMGSPRLWPRSARQRPARSRSTPCHPTPMGSGSTSTRTWSPATQTMAGASGRAHRSFCCTAASATRRSRNLPTLCRRSSSAARLCHRSCPSRALAQTPSPKLKPSPRSANTPSESVL